MADITTGASVAIAPDLEIIEGQVTTTSQQVAAHFGKGHNLVLRAIRNLECSNDFRLNNFAQSSYRNEQGKEQPCYRLTRDGFVFLAMGFTGKDAAQWKEAYIAAFNKMEQELLARTTRQPTLPYSVQPGQTLSADQAQTLRQILADHAATLPQARQGAFMMQGWSRLKAHFKTDYRHIPASQYSEALSIVSRHVVQWTAPAALPAPAPRMVELPPGKIIVDRRKLAAIWVDLGRLRQRLDGLGALDSDLPPSWWDDHAISA